MLGAVPAGPTPPRVVRLRLSGGYVRESATPAVVAVGPDSQLQSYYCKFRWMPRGVPPVASRYEHTSVTQVVITCHELIRWFRRGAPRSNAAGAKRRPKRRSGHSTGSLRRTVARPPLDPVGVPRVRTGSGSFGGGVGTSNPRSDPVGIAGSHDSRQRRSRRLSLTEFGTRAASYSRVVAIPVRFVALRRVETGRGESSPQSAT